MANRLVEQITREGKLPQYSPRLNDAKIMEADRILAGIADNDNRSIQSFKEHLGCRFGEAIHTTGDDFVFAFAQLQAFEVQDQWEAAERTWEQAIGVEEVTSLDTPRSYSINAKSEGFKRPKDEPKKPAHIVPRVPEGSPYPHFQFGAELSEAGSIGKSGGRYDLTMEQIIRDVAGIVPVIPKLITESLLEREEYDAWQGLIDFAAVAGNKLTAATSIEGTAVPVDAPLSRAALIVGLSQARNRVIAGRKVDIQAYTLVVPIGSKETAQWYINTLTLDSIKTGTDPQNTYSVNGYNPLSGITSVVETAYLTGTQWLLIPAKGAISGSRPKFYNLGRLRGHVGPELRLDGATGQYLGGGTPAPFEGSFETDSVAFRGRIFSGGLGWNAGYAVYSTGAGA